MHQNIKLQNVKQKLVELKDEIEKPTVIFGDFHSPLSTIGKTARQKISKYVELNTTNNQQYLINIHRTFYPIREGHIFSSSPYRTYIKKDHIFGRKRNINTFKRIAIIVLQPHGFKLEDYNRGNREISKILETNNTK